MTARRRSLTPVYILQLRPQPGRDGDAIRGLRWGLKTLRRYGLQCIAATSTNAPDRRRRGQRATATERGKEESVMSIGRRKTGGTSLNKLNWDFRDGHFVVEDRVKNDYGTWASENRNIANEEFRATFDMGNIEVGWIAYIKGEGVNAKLVRLGEDYGNRPSENHREGLRLIAKMARELGGDVREMVSTWGVIWTAIDKLHDDYLVGVAKHRDQLPVVEVGGTREESTNKGPILVPVFRIASWTGRTPDLPATGIPLIQRAAKKAATNGNPEPASQPPADEAAKAEFVRPKVQDPFDDEIPF
jgi:hypothetical protein